jgi:hypothetical protein
MKLLDLNRNLQLWRYSPSFSRLLLLANKENIHEDRVALVFQGTQEIHLPTYFFCKSIEAVKTQSDETRFRLLSTKETYLLTALRMDHSKDALDYDAPIPLFDEFFDLR